MTPGPAWIPVPLEDPVAFMAPTAELGVEHHREGEETKHLKSEQSEATRARRAKGMTKLWSVRNDPSAKRRRRLEGLGDRWWSSPGGLLLGLGAALGAGLSLGTAPPAFASSFI